MLALLGVPLRISIVMACAAPTATGAQIQCRLSSEEVPAYSRVEIRFADIFGVDNPDDPRQADVEGIFVSPSGRRWRMPGFLYQDFRRDGDAIIPHGEPEWCVRFTPIEPGKWKSQVQARVAGKTFTADAGAFEVTPTKARGFLRRSKANPLALEFENGEPLVAIGSNVFPTDEEETRLGRPLGSKRAVQVIRYMERTAKAGGTFCRLRMDYNHFPIEMTADEVTGYQGPGRYHAQSCWEMDRMIEAAERLDVTMMLCIECANTTADRGGGPHRLFPLKYNLYLKQNGGPLEASDARDRFWTDPEIKRLFRQKIRYCVARWGASSALGVWEFFNEVVVTPERADNIVAWHRELAAQWRAFDPYKRPITTSVMHAPMSSQEGIWKVFGAPEIDIAQFHTYRFSDVAQGVAAETRETLERIGKPLLVGEFGSYKPLRKELASEVKSRDGEPTIKLHRRIDPTGLHLHNGIWASGLTGAVGALPWFTCDYIDSFDMYHVYTGFSRFVADWKINAGPWNPVAASLVTDARSLGDQRWGPLVLPSKRVMERRAMDVYTVSRDELPLEAEPFNSYLFGRVVHKDLRRPPTFAVDYPVDGRFVVTVDYAVGKPDSKIPVVIYLDGQEAGREVIPIERGQGENALPLNRWGNVEIQPKEELAIDVPAGPHRICVENAGETRVAVDYRLEPYADRSLLTYRVYAMGLGNEVRLWIQNARHTHVNQYYKKLPTTAPSAEMHIPVENNGRYEVEWWDTYEGKPTRHETVTADEGVLTLSFPGTTSDEACKVRRIQ